MPNKKKKMKSIGERLLEGASKYNDAEDRSSLLIH
jgi:hypothetical protein